MMAIPAHPYPSQYAGLYTTTGDQIDEFGYGEWLMPVKDIYGRIIRLEPKRMHVSEYEQWRRENLRKKKRPARPQSKKKKSQRKKLKSLREK